ncbi:hypothetical protein FB565_003312 [Actinoplanes lutulentus]|uniref:hypothetical protein n=1 Tax=Actinoplanes lutulentus TaxID=1287878 RepID=UPI000DBA85D6|nr:hypothetical protein [Actinoplanes lutulentus]MBB2943583.1 hypothetical protein [Actinoplanes lutulentus]
MTDWKLIPCLLSLRGELDRLAPGRDKRTDGAVGDAGHASSSDHTPDEDSTVLRDRDSDRVNEVHAVDVDSSGPWPDGWSMERVVETVVGRHRAGRDDRLQNVIYRRRIWSRSWGWSERAYTGPSPHTEHAHFSARYTTAAENDTGPWGLLTPTAEKQEDTTMTKAEFLALLRDRDVRAALCSAVLTTDDVITAPPGMREKDGSPNTHWSATSYLQQTYGAARAAGNRPEPAVLALAGGIGASDAELAAALRDALGERAAEIGRLLSEPSITAPAQFTGALG